MKHSLVFFGYAIASLGLSFIALLLYITYCIPDCNRDHTVSGPHPERRRPDSSEIKPRPLYIHQPGSLNRERAGKSKISSLPERKTLQQAADTAGKIYKQYLHDKPSKNIPAGIIHFSTTGE